jgi:RES domain
VPTFYRVFPFVANAPARQPGGALYIPPQSGSGRLDNPDLYSVLYLSNSPAGAIAEAFGRFPEWTPAILRGGPSLAGSVRALARYELDAGDPLCNLDDPRQLVRLQLRPSDVVSRDYARTRAWARRIFETRAWAGIGWWSYYDPQWTSVGLWKTDRLSLGEVRELRLDDSALSDAARTIVRRIIP